MNQIVCLRETLGSEPSKYQQEKKSNEDDSYFSQATEFEDKGPIGDYEATYQELCHLLENIKQKWETEDPDENLANKYYQRYKNIIHL